MNKKGHVLNALIVSGIVIFMWHNSIESTVSFAFAVVAFSLVPDIDTATQRLHRKLLHNMWIVIGFGLFAYFVKTPFAVGAAIGVATHIFCDAFGSKQRIRFGWPVFPEFWIGIKGFDPRNNAPADIVIAFSTAVIFSIIAIPFTNFVMASQHY